MKPNGEAVVIVGAGLAGLACARELTRTGVRCMLRERSDRVGERIGTDRHDGFLLDRGFQVLQTRYPEARRQLDYSALDLRPFYPGALIRSGGRFHRVSDVWRHPGRLLEMVVSPVGTVADKLRLRRRCVAAVKPTGMCSRRPSAGAATAAASERLICGGYKRPTMHRGGGG